MSRWEAPTGLPLVLTYPSHRGVEGLRQRRRRHALHAIEGVLESGNALHLGILGGTDERFHRWRPSLAPLRRDGGRAEGVREERGVPFEVD